MNLSQLIKRIFFTSLFVFIAVFASGQGVVITTEEPIDGVEPLESSIFEVRSTDKGVLIPRMNSAQRVAIINPANGLLVYDTDENQFYYYNAIIIEWVKAIGPQGPEGLLEPGEALGVIPYWDGAQWILSSENFVHDGANVGIGTNSPSLKLTVVGSSALPSIPNASSAGIMGIRGDAFPNDGINFGKMSTGTYSGWLQSGWNGSDDPFSINPLGGNVGIATTEPTQSLDVNGTIRLRDHLFDVSNSYGQAGQVLTRSALGVQWSDPAGEVGGSGTAGKIAYWENATDISAVPFMSFNELNQFVEVTSKEEAADDDPIFEVKNKDGHVVLGVYQTGVRILVDDSPGKTSRGGFAVGGFTTGKDKSTVEYLRVTPDSVRVYIDSNAAKTSRGGFAVGGFTTGKGHQELLRVTTDSTRIYFDDSQNKTSRGGFAVGGFTTGKDKNNSGNYMIITPENYLIGHNAGERITTGVFNSILGYQAGRFLGTGDRNVLLGYQAGYSTTSGTYNVFIGHRAGYNNTGFGQNEGSFNIFIGDDSGYENTVGFSNLFIGKNSGYGNVDGGSNVFIGNETGAINQNGTRNVYLGHNAGQRVIGGEDNVHIGHNAGRVPNADFQSSQAKRNTFIGSRSGWESRSSDGVNGSNNTFLGYSAGSSNLTGSNNVFIGHSAGVSLSSSATNVLVVDNQNRSGTTMSNALIYGEFNQLSQDQELRLNSNVIIKHNLTVNGTISKNYGLPLSISTKGEISVVTSDVNKKTEIESLTGALAQVTRLRGVSFLWTDDETMSKGVTLIAQEVENVIPEAVFTNPNDGRKGVHYDRITAVLVEAIKEQQNTILLLKEELAMLKKYQNKQEQQWNEVQELKMELTNLIKRFETSTKE